MTDLRNEFTRAGMRRSFLRSAIADLLFERGCAANWERGSEAADAVIALMMKPENFKALDDIVLDKKLGASIGIRK